MYRGKTPQISSQLIVLASFLHHFHIRPHAGIACPDVACRDNTDEQNLLQDGEQQILQKGMHQGQRLSMLGKALISVELRSRKPWKVCEPRATHVRRLPGSFDCLVYLAEGSWLAGGWRWAIRKSSSLHAMIVQGRGACRYRVRLGGRHPLSA